MKSKKKLSRLERDKCLCLKLYKMKLVLLRNPEVGAQTYPNGLTRLQVINACIRLLRRDRGRRSFLTSFELCLAAQSAEEGKSLEEVYGALFDCLEPKDIPLSLGEFIESADAALAEVSS